METVPAGLRNVGSPHRRECIVLRSRFLQVVLLGAFVASATSLAAQQGPPVRDLPKASAEIEDPYSLVIGLRESSRGRVVVADGGDGEVSVVDFATGERSAVGRQGSGPGEYRMPAGLFRVRGDTIWVLDQAQSRVATFLPDLKAGVPFHLQMFDTQSRTALIAPFHVDDAGRMYSSALPVAGPNMQIPDSLEVIRFDPRQTTAPRTTISKVRFPTSGTPEMKVEGTVIRYKMAFPGLVTADSWAVFPDGRIAIVHGANYTVEYVGTDGKRTTSKPITFERFSVSKADQEAEMAEAKRQLAEQMKAVKRGMPPGMTLDMNMTEPESWPATYPAISPMSIFAAPDGMLWVRRAIPARLGREQWDVVDGTGALVARWRLPARTRVVGVGAGVVYAVRMDEDDLQYLQRIPVGR